MHEKILALGEAAFVIIDVQEGFRSVIPDFGVMCANIALFAQGAQILDVPILVTEQYPKGLGRTAEEVLFSLPADLQLIEKTAFSSCGAQNFVKQLNDLNIRQVIVAGIEAHVCVNQTTHDLLNDGFQVHLLTDCISARFTVNREAAFAKMQQSGAVPSTVEMALFELLRDARHEQFKEIQQLVK